MNCKHLFISLIFSLFLVTLNHTAYSQVEDIKEASERNSEENDDGFGGDDDWIVGFVVDMALDFFTLGFDYHRYQLFREKDQALSHITSIELQGIVGYANGNTFAIAPRVRGNWGLMSADFRYFNLIGGGLYQTLDGQFLLNIVNEKGATLRIGTGFMHEYLSGKRTFNEHFVGLDIRWDEPKTFTSNAEFRIAKDYFTGATPRLELNLRLNHKILETGRITGYWTIGGIYQRYFNEVNVWTGQTGLSFVLE